MLPPSPTLYRFSDFPADLLRKASFMVCPQAAMPRMPFDLAPTQATPAGPKFSSLKACFFGNMILVKGRIGQADAWFLIDSGVPKTTVFQPEASSPTASGGSDVRVEGFEKEPALNATKVPYAAAPVGLGAQIKGLLGLDFLRQKALLIDYAKKSVAVSAGGSFQKTGAAQAMGVAPDHVLEITLVDDDGLPAVRSTIKGVPFLMVLDTGSDVVSLNSRRATEIGLVSRQSGQVNSSGTIIGAQVYEGVSIKVGKLSLVVDRAISEEPDDDDDGILPTSAFPDGKVLVDFASSRLFVCARAPLESGALGDRPDGPPPHLAREGLVWRWFPGIGWKEVDPKTGQRS